MSNTATTTGIILALDLGQYKSVACADHGDPAAATFTGLTTDREHLTRLFARHRPTAVVIEACLLAGWVHDLCHDLGLPCHVANTASEAWKFKHTKRKTDKDDALRLAPLFALGQLPTVTVPPPATRQGRTLIAGRQALVGRRVAVQNRIRAILGGQRLPAPRGVKAWTVPGLEGIGRFAKPLAACAGDELWRGRLDLALAERRQVRALADQVRELQGLVRRIEDLVEMAAREKGRLSSPALTPAVRRSVARTVRLLEREAAKLRAEADGLVAATPELVADRALLESIPGVGRQTATVILAELPAVDRLPSAPSAAAYCGLSRREFTSGASVRRKTRLSEAGNPRLRKALFLPAQTAVRFNPPSSRGSSTAPSPPASRRCRPSGRVCGSWS